MPADRNPDLDVAIRMAGHGMRSRRDHRLSPGVSADLRSQAIPDPPVASFPPPIAHSPGRKRIGNAPAARCPAHLLREVPVERRPKTWPRSGWPTVPHHTGSPCVDKVGLGSTGSHLSIRAVSALSSSLLAGGSTLPETRIHADLGQRRWLVSLTKATDVPPSAQTSMDVRDAGAVASRQMRS